MTKNYNNESRTELYCSDAWASGGREKRIIPFFVILYYNKQAGPKRGRFYAERCSNFEWRAVCLRMGGETLQNQVSLFNCPFCLLGL